MRGPTTKGITMHTRTAWSLKLAKFIAKAGGHNHAAPTDQQGIYFGYTEALVLKPRSRGFFNQMLSMVEIAARQIRPEEKCGFASNPPNSPAGFLLFFFPVVLIPPF